jgi:hypothetical protein
MKGDSNVSQEQVKETLGTERVTQEKMAIVEERIEHTAKEMVEGRLEKNQVECC